MKQRHDEFTAAMSEIGLSGKTRYQRMILYQFAIASFLSGLESGGTSDLLATFMNDEFIARLAAKGWEFSPYKP